MTQRTTTFLRDQRGATGLVFAATLTTLAVAAASAVDYAGLSAARAELQTTADAAALAGAKAMALSVGQTTGQRERQARAGATEAAAGQATDAQLAVTASVPNRTVRVTLAQTRPLAFGRLLGMTHARIDALGAATFAEVEPACVIALGAAEPIGIGTSGSGAIAAPRCTLWSNATSASSVSFAGESVVARRICAVGGRSGTSTPPAQARCAPYPNPFASVDFAAIGKTCAHSGPSVGGGQVTTLSPGVYCGPIHVQGTLHLQPGLYVFRDGEFRANGAARITGTGVSILLAGSSFLSWSGKAQVTLSASRTGPLAGIVIASEPTGPALTSELKGDVDLTTLSAAATGSIYLPNQTVKVWGSGTTTLGGEDNKLVARAIELGGNAQLKVDADDLVEMREAVSSLRLSE